MAELENNFAVGQLVTFKSHPLLKVYEIKGDGKYVPPIMVVKEVLIEDRKKKTHDDTTGYQIAERVKYICSYFDDNKSEFVEVHLYQSMLEDISTLKIGRLHDPERINSARKNLVDEVAQYPLQPTYDYGKILYFKTLKLEVLKKRSSVRISRDVSPGHEGTPEESTDPKKKKIIQYVVNYATPEFVICGFKNEVYTDLFYNDGKPKRVASTNFVKVKWFNPYQHKFSEQYLPMEFFIEKNPFPLKEAIL